MSVGYAFTVKPVQPIWQKDNLILEEGQKLFFIMIADI